MTQSIGQKFTPLSLLKFALPSMVMMVFMSLYTIVDGIFVSRFAGSEALSAVNIVFPVACVLLAVGIMLATGGSAVAAKKLGEGKGQEARENFTMFVAAGILQGIPYRNHAFQSCVYASVTVSELLCNRRKTGDGALKEAPLLRESDRCSLLF